MAIVHVNGFGTFPVAGDYLGYTPPTTGTPTLTRQPGRSGGYALRHSNNTAGTLETLAARLGKGGPHPDLSVGVAINFRGAWTPSANTLGFMLGANTTWEVKMGTTGTSFVIPGGHVTPWTVLDSSGSSLGWHWWNFVYHFGGTGGICEVYRDGTKIASANGNTSDFGVVPATFRIYIGNDNGGAQADIGDLVWKNDATVIPDTVVTSLFPDATTAGAWVGSDGNSVDNHLLVNENPTYNAATYVGSATVNAVDTYTLADLPNPAASVSVVQVGVRAFKSDAAAKTLAPMINGTAGTAADPGVGATLYRLATTNPSGGAAWDTASVNAMTTGVKVVS